MNRLLVATDFSPRSDRALRRAVLICKKLGATLTVLHVVDGDRPESLIASDHASAGAVLEDITRTLRSEDGIIADPMVIVEDVHIGIMRAAEKADAELIVVGPHRNRLRDVFIGTITERVVRLSTRSVLVAVELPASHYKKTLLALDFDEASKAAGHAALEMGIFDLTEVVVMHAFDAPGESMMRRSMQPEDEIAGYVRSERDVAAENLRALRAELGLPVTSQTIATDEGSTARAILDSAQSAGSDLIVMGTNQRGGLERMLVGSVTENVIREAHRDVLIIPVNERQ